MLKWFAAGRGRVMLALGAVFAVVANFALPVAAFAATPVSIETALAPISDTINGAVTDWISLLTSLLPILVPILVVMLGWRFGLKLFKRFVHA